MLFLQSDFGLFLGHLHPLAVHLPIGFLFLAGIFHYLGRKEKYHYLNKALPMTWGLSALSAICLLYTSPSPRDLSTSRMPSSA